MNFDSRDIFSLKHAVAALFHFISGGVATGFAAKDDANLAEIVYEDTVFNVNVMVLIATFSYFTGLAHTFYALSDGGIKNSSKYRYIFEFSVTAPIMIVIISILCEEKTLVVLLLQGFLMGTTMYFGYLQDNAWFEDVDWDNLQPVIDDTNDYFEKRQGYAADDKVIKFGKVRTPSVRRSVQGEMRKALNKGTYETEKLLRRSDYAVDQNNVGFSFMAPFILGFVPFIAVWVTLLLRFSHAAEDVPGFVTAIFFTELVLFMTFPLAALWAMMSAPTHGRIHKLDTIYVVLSYVSKASLVWLAIGGALNMD